jgi:hypothetical protein
MEKVIRDGKVAVLYSPGFGAGFYTWNGDNKELLFNPKLVEMVEQGKANQIDEDWVKENLGIENVYCEGADDLIIKWIPEGTVFTINEYGGNESIELLDDIKLVA